MLSFLLYHFCPDSEQSRDLPVLIHVDFFRGENLREARHGSPRGWPRGGPSFLALLGENEFRLRQGFAVQNACTPHLRRA